MSLNKHRSVCVIVLLLLGGVCTDSEGSFKYSKNVKFVEREREEPPQEHFKKPTTDLSTDPYNNLLVISTLDGTLTAVDRISGELRWVSRDDKPMIQVPIQEGNLPKTPYFLPDPKTGSLYMMGKQNSLRKLPFTIPQLVAMAPCRNSEGLMYTGRKTDYWLQLNPFTGEKSEIHGEETCPAWSSTHVNEESCSADNPHKRVLKNLLIGKTEYTLSMMDGPRKWNVTYHHYSSKDMNQQSLQDYDLVHFTSPSIGSLMTYDRLSGELLYHRELDSPVIGMYTIDGTTTNLVSVPFNPIASDTLNRLKNTNTENNKHLSPTTYVGECAYGLYAVPALADGQVLMISAGASLPPLIEGPMGPSAEPLENPTSHEYLLLGFYETGESGNPIPNMQIESQSKGNVPPGAFNESGFIEDRKIIRPPQSEQNITTEETNGEPPQKHEEESTDSTGKSPKPVFPPIPPKRKIEKHEIKIVFTTAIISIGITSTILGIVFILYRRYKNEQLLQQVKLLSSDNHSNPYGSEVSNSSTHSNVSKRDSSSDGSTQTIGKITLFPSEILGKGCEGTFVFKGKFEDRNVAVKRILPECFQFADREVDLLKESDQHEHVIRYFCTETDGQFRYIALELCIATLHDWVEGRYKNELIKPVDVLRDATNGLAHLHALRIVHRDVKPANVLLSEQHGRVRTVISDFGLCKKLQNGRMSFSRRSGGVPGTDGWIAPEVLRNADTMPERMTYSVDIFSMGCVYYYVLSKGSHPFGDAFRRQSNILNGEYDVRLLNDTNGGGELIEMMISSNSVSRPPLNAVLSHPLFWSNERTLTFFQDVSDRIEKESESTSPILRRYERDASEIVQNDWRDHICNHVAMDLRKYRTYKGESIRDLLRALRNKKNHYRELTVEAQESLGHIPNEFVNYWVTRFPKLLPYTWVMFECLKHEQVFTRYYAQDFDFYDVLRNDDDLIDLNDLTVENKIELKESPKLDKEFWKSKSQAKYQKWRGGRGRGYARNHQPRTELSASTDNYWRNTTPSPNRNQDP
ncbi:unnamed protein product [Orchesella dallaii]|uniref:Non-specific serine/threonine protein kinase n=1 Tax=Orchesella dallaii TaxID=48710 RepID=A0ABP1RA84_9HEXA